MATEESRPGAEAELERLRRTLEELQHVARLGTWEWDVATDRVEWSSEMYRITGIEVGTPLDYDTYTAIHHPEDREAATASVRRSLETGEPYVVQHRVVRRDGAVRWIEGRGIAERDSSGRVTRLFGTALDVTETKEAEQAAASERELRLAAEQLAERLRFIAEASAVLASSLDHETTLRSVAELAVPRIADWCAVDLLQNGTLQRVAVRHTDPSKLELVRELEQEYPTDMNAPNGVPKVLRTGELELVTEIPQQLLEAAARDERHLEKILALGLRSYIAAPLKARGRVLGALTLVHAESGRRFEADDVEFVEDLARRAAMAIDNAALVKDLEETQRQLEEQSAELEGQAVELEAQTEQLEAETRQGQELLADLTRERARLAAVIEHAPVGIIIAEAPSGRVLLGNPTAERILRHPVMMVEDVSQYARSVAYHRDGTPVGAEEFPLARTLSSGAVEGPDELLYRRGDGTTAWVQLTAAPLRDEEGTLTGALVLVDDIDAEQRAAEEREQLLEQVRAERRLLRQIFEHAPAVMALYSGPEHRVTLVNPLWERTVGKPGAAGSTFREVFPEFADTGLFEKLDEIYASGEPYHNPEQAVRLERWNSDVQEDTYWDLVWLPLPAREDGSRDILVHAVEITDQVRARQQVHGLNEAALAVQSATSVDEVAEVVTELAPALLGARHAETTLATAAESMEPSGSTLRRSESRSDLEAPLVGRDGSRLGVIRLARRQAGEFSAADEAVLVQLAQITSVAIENLRLYERAVEASRAKSDFLATMSHELRTPLNAMIGYSELLQMGIPDPITDASKAQVERIRLSANHLLQLIEEILTFSRIDAGRERVTIEAVSLETLTSEVRAIIEPLAAQKRIDFRVTVPEQEIEMHTDPRKVRQILLNLIGNAVKFTHEGRVEFAAARDGEMLRLDVKDTGIGIEKENLGRIFEPFWQAETSLHTRAGGTGLGLPVTKRFVDLLGGTLDVVSEPGIGTHFRVWLPLEAVPAD